ncbi:hypothetical protein [Candidatus Chloroploca mongolica]|uniref:hypothetical protein n=1 Tax=Candidatus Chloroploca mongolica TaxID=2528176 RepID=UPI0020B365D5|nr:hypothetical protein [Candidatus Chloroploca mongolica]
MTLGDAVSPAICERGFYGRSITHDTFGKFYQLWQSTFLRCCQPGAECCIVTLPHELGECHDQALSNHNVWANQAKLLDIRLLRWRELDLGLAQQPAGLSR